MPTASFKYRSAGIFAGATSDDFSASVQDATGARVVLVWQANIANDRLAFQINTK